MAVVAIAILISFHLKHSASNIEKRVALPLGVIFWGLSLLCLVSGLSNYVKTVNRFSRRQALVQSGIGTQVVSFLSLLRYISIACQGMASVIVAAYMDEATDMMPGLHRSGVCNHRCLCLVSEYECYNKLKFNDFMQFPWSCVP